LVFDLGGLVTAQTMLQILGAESRPFRNTGQHPRADLL